MKTAALVASLALALSGAAIVPRASAQQAPAPQGQTPPRAVLPTPAPAALVEVENEALVVERFAMNVDDMEDSDVYGPDGERVGEIDEVLMTPEGEIVAVSIEVGGFLGIGDREVIVRLDQLQRQGDRFMLTLTRDELRGLPAWAD